MYLLVNQNASPMKFKPKYQFVEKIHVEKIVMYEESEILTLLVRIEEQNGISSLKHVFCSVDQFAQLLTEDNKDVDDVLDYMVFLMTTDNIGNPEEIDVEALIDHPLCLSKYKLRVYHPMVQNTEDEPMQIDLNLFELDLTLPKH